MKQFIVMVLLMAFGMGGSIFWTPAAGVGMYYFFAVLRPQYIWRFQLTGYPSLNSSFYVAAAAIGAYLLWSVGLLSYGKSERSVMRYAPAFNWAHRAMMLFAVWITLSYIFSNDQARSEDWYGEYLKIFIMYFIAARVIRTANQVWVLFMAITVALAYIAFDANQDYIKNGSLKLLKRGFAMLDNNGVGLLLALGVPLCFFAWEMTRKWYRWLFLFGAMNIVHAVLTTYSRGAMVAMLAPFFHYVAFWILFSRKKLQVFIVGILAMVAVSIMAGKEITDRFTSIEKREVDGSYQSRQLSWSIAIDIANDYPLVGAGIRCSANEMKKRGADMEGRTIHSQYLQLAADSGWVSLALYLLVLATTFAAIWKARLRLWRRKDPDAVRALAILNGVECSLVSYSVGALALSLEVFEPAYLLMLIGAQVWALLNSTDTARPSLAVAPVIRRPMPRPAPPREPVTATPRQGPSTGIHPFSRLQQPGLPRRSGS